MIFVALFFITQRVMDTASAVSISHGSCPHEPLNDYSYFTPWFVSSRTIKRVMDKASLYLSAMVRVLTNH